MSTLVIENEPSRASGRVLIAITGGAAVALTLVSASFLRPAFRKHCLPYVPATIDQVSNVVRALSSCRPLACSKLIDLGSGDGRIVMAASKYAVEAHGVELNMFLVMYSKLRAMQLGHKNVTIFRRNLWHHNLAEYDRVVIFGVESMMENVETKLLKECRLDTIVIACRFPLPNLTPIRQFGDGVDRVWVYNLHDNRE